MNTQEVNWAMNCHDRKSLAKRSEGKYLIHKRDDPRHQVTFGIRDMYSAYRPRPMSDSPLSRYMLLTR